MEKINIGIIREGKNPPDKRVPFTPAQCRALKDQYPQLDITVQPSSIRCFHDEEYEIQGIRVSEDLSDRDILFGVKEVPIDMLMPNKTYFFFSHTFKKQPYNRDLLRAVLEKKIRLVDYEVLTAASGKRLVGFGRYAGVVGAYNALFAYGKKTNRYELRPAHTCADRRDMESELSKVSLPKNFRLALTGGGRVAGGTIEILTAANLKQVSPEDFLNEKFDEPIFTQLLVKDYVKRVDGASFKPKEFYANPEHFESNFMTYAGRMDVYVACHYWDNRSPFIFTRDDARDPVFNIRVVADVSCDIDGPVATTLRPSTIADPLYGYDPYLEREVGFMENNAVGVMAVDNLPCELPKDASEDFGNELMKNVVPALISDDPTNIIARASETDLHGNLTEEFSYLEDYVLGKE